MSVFRFFLAVVIVIGCCRWLAAAELVARDLTSSTMAVLIEVNRPIQLIDNPLGRDVWDLVRQTNGVQQALKSPEVERFRQAAKFIEKSLAVDWRTGLERLTAGGILVAVQPAKPPAEPAVTIVVTSADEQTLKQFIDAVQVEIHRSANAAAATGGNNTAEANAKDKLPARKVPETETISYRSFTVHRVGNGYFSLVGRQLVASNTQAQLESALDRLAGAATGQPFELPASLRLVDVNGTPPAILATVNLQVVREDPKTQSGLRLPANEAILPFLVGGYLDLFRRADFVAAGLFVDGPAYEVQLRFPVGTEGAYAGLRGFFASGATESAPPLLRPTGTIFSAGWFRDFEKLWEARQQLVNAGLAEELDAANERARTDGLHVAITDFVQWIGPHFRVVAARQRENVYKRMLDERLPALALVVGLRDENAVRDRILAPADGLLLVALGKTVDDYKKVEYRDAKLTTFRFAEKADEADPGKAVLFQFNPAYTIARGQLIIGSTAEIVRDLIDDLERQSQAGTSPERGPERPTDRQQISLAELSEFLKGYQNRFERDVELRQGLSPANAAKEIEVMHNLLKRLGSLTTSSLVAPDHFDIHIRLGPGYTSHGPP